MATRKAASKRSIPDERLSVTSGNLGPVGPCEIDVKPLTVLVGRQGTGKSLVAQVLYFFRGLPSLVRLDLASHRPDAQNQPPEKVIRRIVDGLRSSHRSFARLTVPSVALRWQGSTAVGGMHAQRQDLKLNVQSKTSQVQPSSALVDLVKKLSKPGSREPLTATFVPTERLLYAMALGPTSLRVMSAPVILETFSQMMDLAGRIQSDWTDGEPDTDEGKWVREHLSRALAGEGRMRGTSWRWTFESDGAERQIDLDMASSGQRANWPLSIIPQVLFSLRSHGELAERFTVYVEEPEIHLHPAAERAVVEVLAYLVNHGFRVVVTTHSITVLYTLNNLLMASELPPRQLTSEIPPNIRLRVDDVAAYHLQPSGPALSLMSGSGTIDERALARVADDLSLQMNEIMAKRGPTR
jgi:hypothetical protein